MRSPPPEEPDVACVRAAWAEHRFALGLGPDDAALDVLLTRYREPHRRYHDLAHLAACLRTFEAHRALAQRPAEVVHALLFHDAVYAPMASDNEARSAALAREVLARGGADPDAVDRIARAIEATRTHEPPPGEPDAALVLDVDMSILAAPPDAFDAYEAAVRAELPGVPDEAFARGRGAFVRELSARPRLFWTPALHEAWDARARANLTRSVERWG